MWKLHLGMSSHYREWRPSFRHIISWDAHHELSLLQPQWTSPLDVTLSWWNLPFWYKPMWFSPNPHRHSKHILYGLVHKAQLTKLIIPWGHLTPRGAPMRLRVGLLEFKTLSSTSSSTCFIRIYLDNNEFFPTDHSLEIMIHRVLTHKPKHDKTLSPTTRIPTLLNFILIFWSSLYFLLIDHIIFICSTQWYSFQYSMYITIFMVYNLPLCQYSMYIIIFMAYNLESNTWSSSITYGTILHKQLNEAISP
jgi:hypothetical protein